MINVLLLTVLSVPGFPGFPGFLKCLENGGPGITPAGAPTYCRKAWDIDWDGDVDLQDYARLTVHFSGEDE